MSNVTYEFEKRTQALETYEWDYVWWDHAGTQGVPRVLYIGDSISFATRPVATAQTNNEILFDGFSTSKALDNPYFQDAVRLFALQQGERRAIVFNNGLHGWHLEDSTEYKEYYEKFIQFLLKEFEGTPIVLLLTTAVEDKERNARVQIRNKAVEELGKKYDLPVLDLYSPIDGQRESIFSDGVHLIPDGYKLLAKKLIKKVKEVM